MKIIKRIAIGLFSLILLLVAILFWQKDNIVDSIIDYANNSMPVHMDYESSNLSFWKSWPHISIVLNDIRLLKKGNTSDSLALAQIDHLSVGVKLWSIISPPYQIGSIDIEAPKLFLRCDSDAHCNYDFLLAEETTDSTDLDSDEESLSFSIDQLSWNKAQLHFNDLKSNMNFSIEEWDANWTISYIEDLWNVGMSISNSKINFDQQGVSWASDMQFQSQGDIQYDAKSGNISIDQNEYVFNDLKLLLEGSVLSLEKGQDIDLQASFPGRDIKSLISIIPGAYNHHYKGLSTSGQVDFDLNVDGVLHVEDENYPSFTSQLNIQNGSLKYEGVPESFRDIQLEMNFNKEQGRLESMQLLIDNFTAKMGSSAIIDHRMELWPMNEQKTNLGQTSINGTAADLKSSFPLEKGTSITGDINLNANYSFTLEQIYNELWEQVNIKAEFIGQNLSYESEGSPPLKSDRIQADMNQGLLTAEAEGISYGNSLISFLDVNTQPLSYLLGQKKTLEGDIQLKGKYLDVDQIMGYDIQEIDTVRTTVHPIDISPFTFELDVDIDELRYDEYDLTEIQAKGSLDNDRMNIRAFDCIYESSKISCSGTVGDISDYLNSVSDLTVNFDCAADAFDLWAYLSEEDAESNSQNEEEAPFYFPPDIALTLDYTLGKVDYSDIQFQEIRGQLTLLDQVMEIQPTRMSAFGGDLSLEGIVKTPEQKNINYHFDIATKNSEFQKVFESVELVQDLAPVMEYIFGIFNTRLSLDGELDGMLSPILSSLSAQGLLETIKGKISNYSLLEKVDRLVGTQLEKNMTFNRTVNWFAVENGTVVLEPFTMELGKEPWTITGSHQIQGDMDYTFSGPVSLQQMKNSDLGAKIYQQTQSALSGLGFPESTVEEKLEITIAITGDHRDPKIKLQPKTDIQAQLKSRFQEKKEEKKEEIKKQLKKEGEEVKKEAEKAAKDIAEKAKEEARKQIKAMSDSTKQKGSLDSIKNEAKKKAEEAKKKLKKWNPFGD
jgi:hypothetical protein